MSRSPNAGTTTNGLQMADTAKARRSSRMRECQSIPAGRRDLAHCTTGGGDRAMQRAMVALGALLLLSAVAFGGSEGPKPARDVVSAATKEARASHKTVLV